MNSKLNLGIDCFNISRGGGFTHLIALLRELNNIVDNNVQVILWGSESLIRKLPNYFWLSKKSNFLLNYNIFARFFWHLFIFRLEIKKLDLDVLLCPGGVCVHKYAPRIVMFRNVLPFLNNEVKKYNFLKQIRFRLFKLISLYSFKNSQGIIYLSNWSKSFMDKVCNFNNLNIVIPHGVRQRNFKISSNFHKSKVDLIYVSHTSPYKNYDYVLENLIQLALENKKSNFRFLSIGEITDGFSVDKWIKLLPENLEVKFEGNLSHEKTLNMIKKSDICIFASSAENFPNVLLEYMSLGSVCLSNNIEPMKSILKEAGVFFDVKINDDLKNKIKLIIKNQDMQEKLKMLSYEKSKRYTWYRTADLTLKFCYKVAQKNKSIKNGQL